MREKKIARLGIVSLVRLGDCSGEGKAEGRTRVT
jgi:hypothetical protein